MKKQKGIKEVEGIRGALTGTDMRIRVDKTGRIYMVTDKMLKGNKVKK